MAQLAEEYQLLRKFLYQQRDKAGGVLLTALSAHAPGPKAASQQNRQLALPRPVSGEADEIFQGRNPCLTVVDGHSFAIMHLSPRAGRDATTWGVSFLDLQEQGIRFQDVACDGAKGIRSGMEQAELCVPLRPDLFHLLREASVLMRRSGKPIRQ